jgi:hypothetical protein
VKLVDYDGDSVILEWDGPSGETPVLRVSETDDLHKNEFVEASYALQQEECRALAAALVCAADWLAERDRREMRGDQHPRS